MTSRFISTKRCKRGHLGERYIRTRNCVECERIRSRERCTTDIWRAYQREYLKKRHYEDEKYREKKRALRRRIYRKNSNVIEYVRRRDLAQRKATPPWLTKEHIEQMRNIYEQARKIAKETGVPMDVDHIVPLAGKTVCGLHVPWNLQVIPASLNRKKRNKLPGDSEWGLLAWRDEDLEHLLWTTGRRAA